MTTASTLSGTLCPSRLPNGPPNSTWKRRIEHGKDSKMRMQGKKPADSFAVAVDYLCKNRNVTKSFTFFDSAADLFRQTAHMSQKNFYELIEPGKWTRLYLDIEHYVDLKEESSVGPSGIEEAIQVVKETLLHNWREKFENLESMIDDIAILIASRFVDVDDHSCHNHKYKHSYHVIFPQIYFYGNTGLMKKFVSSLQNDPRLQAQGKKGEPICMIDGNVYHTDQQFRLVESCKRVDGLPSGVLQLIDSSQPRGQPMSIEQLLRTVVTHDEGGGIRISEESIGKLEDEGGGLVTVTVAGKKRSLSTSADDTCPQTQKHLKRLKETREGILLQPSCVEDFQQMLEQAGIQHCDMTGEVKQKDGYDVLPLRNTGPRPCILNRDTIHNNNNAFLIVNSNRVVFKCQSDKCKGKSECLGAPPDSWQGHQQSHGEIRPETRTFDINRSTEKTANHNPTTNGDNDIRVDSQDLIKDGTGGGSREDAMLGELNGDTHAPYWYEITHDEVLQLLDRLAEVIDLRCLRDSSGVASKPQTGNRVQDFLTVAAILKRFQYSNVWQQWAPKHIHDKREQDRVWCDCNAKKCSKDLNDIVKTVNMANKKREAKINQPERVYFPRPKLLEKNSKRITHSINEPYLDQVMSQGRVNVIQSSTGTGKTTQAVAYAQGVGMPILSVCQLRTQVQTHLDDFRKKGLCTIKYDDTDAMKTFQAGKHSIVTTIDSLPKVKRLLEGNVNQYIVLFDEFHSLTGHMSFSNTLQQTRREAFKAMRWLTIHAGKILAMDNEITDIEFKFLDDTLADDSESHCDLTFIKNEFQKFQDVPVYYLSTREEMVAKMLKDISDGKGNTVVCNTKKEAERIHVQLQGAAMAMDNPVPKEHFKLYTSDQGKLPVDVNTEWRNKCVIYSPTITTGIDFQPQEPQNVYAFIEGEDTVSPAAKLQMITRNRCIKTVYIHATQMRNKPVYTSFEEMNKSLDADCHDLPKHLTPELTRQQTNASQVGNLRALQNGPYFNTKTSEDEYTDSDFSRLYKKALWHDNVMRSAFLYNLDGLLRSRGFIIQQRSIFAEDTSKATETHAILSNHTILSNKEADHQTTQRKQEAAEKYIKDEPCDTQEEQHMRARCEQILAAIIGIKETERAANWREIEDMRLYIDYQMKANPDHKHVYLRLFTDPHTVQHYRNLKLAISTDERLQINAEWNSKNDFHICTLDSSNSHVQLLRQMITAFNRGMLPTLWLQSYDLTLRQASYDENESIEIPDEVWGKLKHVLVKMRRPRPRPKNRRNLMDCIYALSENLLGKLFTSRKKTEKASKEGTPRNVYNYLTDQVALRLAIELLAVCQDIKLRDIEPEIVCKYNLKTVRWNHRMK